MQTTKNLRSRVMEIVISAIDDFNKAHPPDQQIPMSPETVLFGYEGALDSLGLVNLVMTIEQAVVEHLGAEVSIGSERALSRRASPFRTVGTMAQFVCELLQEAQDG